VSQLQTATVNSTILAGDTTLALPLVLVADPNATSRERRAEQLRSRGFRVTLARTSFEAIVKASWHLPDLILLDGALEGDGQDDTSALLSTCPATAHIPIVHLAAGGRLTTRALARLRG
jgi:CheY-like chemotaxis protein